MKLGILLAGKRPDDIAARLEQAREAGFSLCQLNLHQPGFTRGDLLAVADRMADLGIRPLAIGCYVNPMRPGDARFMGAGRPDLDTVLQCVDLIGARRVVLWSGSHHDAPHDPHPDNRAAGCLDTLRGFLTDVVRTTRARHYYLVLEPWHAHVLHTPAAIAHFHSTLEPVVSERVRYVLDATCVIPPERYGACTEEAVAVCKELGPLAGVVHLRDCSRSDDGEPTMAAPGTGALDYAAYLAALERSVPHETPAIVRGVPAAEYAEARDRLLRLSSRWELV